MRFTQQEIEVIIKCVRKSPNNLQMGFEDAAKRLKISKASIQAKWYNSIRKQVAVLSTVSKTHKTANNQKNFKRDTGMNELEGIFANLVTQITKSVKEQMKKALFD